MDPIVLIVGIVVIMIFMSIAGAVMRRLRCLVRLVVGIIGLLLAIGLVVWFANTL